MDNNGSILDKLIDKVVFKQMEMYEAALKDAASETDKLVAAVDKLIEAGNKITTIEDAAKILKKLANIEVGLMRRKNKQKKDDCCFCLLFFEKTLIFVA